MDNPLAVPSTIGIPEGLTVVDLRVAGDDDYEIVNGVIYKGKRPGAASGVIVKPSEGYVFEQSKFDLRSYGDTYIVTKIIAPTAITASLKFTVVSQHDLDTIQAALEGLKGLPGLVSMERS